MDYKKIYDSIVERAKREVEIRIQKRKSKTDYFESHHIIPVCMNGEGRTRDFRHPNIVLLTAKEHFIAHQLLCEIYPSNSKLKHALWAMISNWKGEYQQRNYIISSRLYERTRHYGLSGENHNRYKKTYEECYGKERAEDIKRKIADTIKTSGLHQLSVMNPERREKISKFHKGKPKSEEAKKNMSKNHADVSGDKNPMYGKTHTEVVKNKLRDRCKKQVGSLNPFYGKKHTPESIEKMRESQRMWRIKKQKEKELQNKSKN